MEVTITSENFETLKSGNKPLVIDFWATWCGPCRMVAPIISEMAEKYEKRAPGTPINRAFLMWCG